MSTEKELLEEIKKLRKAVEEASAKAEDSARRARYEKLKAEGKLSLLSPKSTYGMPEVPSYEEWDGMSEDEAEAWRDYLPR